MKHKDDKKNLYKENSTDFINSTNEKKDENSHHEDENNKISDFDIKNSKQVNNTTFTKRSNAKSNKGKYLLIYGIIIIGIVISFIKANNKLNNGNQFITNAQSINGVSNFNSSNVNLRTLKGVQDAQASQLKTFSDTLMTPFIPSNYQLDPMNLNLLNGLYVESGENSSQNLLTLANATKILNSTTIPFSTTASYFNKTSSQTNELLLTLDKNLYVTNVINEPTKGLGLVSFDFGTQANDGQLVTVEGIALLVYRNNSWSYSRMIEQKSVKTYSYLTDNDLKNIFNTYMTNAHYSLIPSSIKISDINVVNPHLIKATISAKGISVFANGQINKSNINKTWNVTFVKDRNSSLSTTFLKLVVGDWNVYQI